MFHLSYRVSVFHLALPIHLNWNDKGNRTQWCQNWCSLLTIGRPVGKELVNTVSAIWGSPAFLSISSPVIKWQGICLLSSCHLGSLSPEDFLWNGKIGIQRTAKWFLHTSWKCHLPYGVELIDSKASYWTCRSDEYWYQQEDISYSTIQYKTLNTYLGSRKSYRMWLI